MIRCDVFAFHPGANPLRAVAPGAPPPAIVPRLDRYVQQASGRQSYLSTAAAGVESLP